MPALVPLIDLTPWFRGGAADRADVARQVDQALRTSGFLLITGHGVPPGVRARTRAVAREFFALPAAGEDLLSLIFFYELNHDAVVESLPPPIGRTSFPPVVAHEYLARKLDVITVPPPPPSPRR